ncbi:AMP-binding protein [Pelosinus fermentans]|uniref:Long-chain-fatty-acid--CoA ligase n=1 Tax=Pelosinus fermentans JBW45 TaxID=1192197 RepID=I8TXG8_9FIRM|nr:AMP-binding protein [Pelosinus fermentans]AJQ28033.1 Long-chain-fatty-acid--CoA ligase [Pelosinus fermentans JBW45]
MRNFGKITIGQLIDLRAKENTKTEALVYSDLNLRYNYDDFRYVCNQAAKGLMKLGVQKGEHIAIWATNVPQWVITQFGSAKMGAVLVTVNTNYKIFELEYLLKQSDTTTLILIKGTKSSDYISMLYQLCPELHNCKPGELKSQRLPFLRNIIVIDEKNYPGMFTWNELIEIGNTVTDEELAVRQDSLDPDDVISMMYTSGTTGFPKGVMLTHNNLIGNACSLAECMDFTKKDRLCIPVPFFHCFGCVLGTMACVVSGATMVPIVVFNPIKVLETIEKESCTAVHGVPTMFIMELEEMEKNKYDTSSLRTGIMAGSPCPIEVMKKVVDKMGVKEITITYGQTEASPGITMTRTDDPLELRVTTVGRALPNVEVKIIDSETGKEVPRNTQGELCSRGYNTMKGYYKMIEATAAAIDNDGWLHTGDLAVMDENGYCKITGRLKDMIIRGGENIYPREIEEFIYTHPKVKDVQVVGVPSEKYGEEVMAFIQIKPGNSITEEELKEYCREKIARYKIPKYIAFVDGYPITASGKIQKYKLRELAMELLGIH